MTPILRIELSRDSAIDLDLLLKAKKLDTTFYIEKTVDALTVIEVSVNSASLLLGVYNLIKEFRKGHQHTTLKLHVINNGGDIKMLDLETTQKLDIDKIVEQMFDK